MKIAVDFDGTIADTNHLMLELLNFKHGTSFTSNDLVSYDSIRTVLFPEEDFWFVYDMLDRTHLRRAIRPVSPFACPTIKRLFQEGHELEVLTANSPRAVRDMIAWLFGHGLDMNVRAIERQSGKVKPSMDYDLFFDDAPTVAEEMPVYPQKRLILVDQPWNREVFCFNDPGSERKRGPRHLNVFRLLRWEDALDLLRSMGLISP